MSIGKTLILYAPCGAGHKKAAEALAGYFSEQPGITVEVKDILDFAPAWYRFIYRDGYYFLIRKSPKLWSLLYQGTEAGYREYLITWILRMIEDNFFKPFYLYLKTSQPADVITTHFLPVSLLKDKKRDYRFSVVVTDYYPHSLWVSNKVDNYFVASDYVKQILRQKGVPQERIINTGIPIKPIIKIPDSKTENRLKMQLSGKLFTALILSGAGGVGDLASIIRGLEKFAEKMQVIVSTGLNKELQSTLEKLAAKASLKIHVVGFTDRIYEYYAASDVAITKPGGLTVTECLAFGLPLLMINAIPGQEEENAKFVTNNKAGLLVPDIRRLPDIIGNWLQDPVQLNAMKQQALAIAPQGTLEKIYQKLY